MSMTRLQRLCVSPVVRILLSDCQAVLDAPVARLDKTAKYERPRRLECVADISGLRAGNGATWSINGSEDVVWIPHKLAKPCLCPTRDWVSKPICWYQRSSYPACNNGSRVVCNATQHQSQLRCVANTATSGPC
ncbi:hypothetical protein HDK77DRAFT_211026 [Phyllosticta capitalensis]|uniref:uncharacterized protein n=1 Tax=Phyllosticta capitalensis TaxID=121624 RepID=UPI00312DDF40